MSNKQLAYLEYRLYIYFVSVEFYTLWWAGFFCVWCFIGSNCNSYLYCREIPMVSRSQLDKVCLYENVPEKCDGTSDCGDSNSIVSVSIWWRRVTGIAVFYYLLITSKKTCPVYMYMYLHCTLLKYESVLEFKLVYLAKTPLVLLTLFMDWYVVLWMLSFCLSLLSFFLFQSHEVQELSLLFVRHAERVDAVMGKEWVKNCFEDSGAGSE